MATGAVQVTGNGVLKREVALGNDIRKLFEQSGSRNQVGAREEKSKMTSAGVSEMSVCGRGRRSNVAHFHSGILDCGEKESTAQLVISRVHLRGKMEERYIERLWLHSALKPCV